MSRLVCLLSPVLLLCGCDGGDATNAPAQAPDVPATVEVALRPVRLALNWYPEPEFGGFYEGVLGGHYRDAGFDVEIIPGGPGAPTLELLSAGRADVAVSAGDDLLLKRSKGVAAIGVWPAFQHNPQGLMVRADSGVQTYADIGAGHQIAIEVGGPFQAFLWSKFGWEGAVEAVPYGGSVGPFLASDDLIQQGYITSEPCAARAKGVAVRFLGAGDAGWDPYGVLLAVADPAPAWTADFLAATDVAWKAYLADPSRANAEIGRLNDQLTPDLLACITDAQRPFVVGDGAVGAMRAERWAGLAQSMVGLGLLPAGSTADGAWQAR